jgi:hypothetical protein
MTLKLWISFWRSGRVVKAFDSNLLKTLGIKSIRGQEFESLGRRHFFFVFLLVSLYILH